jgi:hypothetical protein
MLSQKTLFSSVTVWLDSDSLRYKSNSWFAKEEFEIGFRYINFDAIYERKSVKTSTTVISVGMGLFLSALLFTKFKVYTNLDSFVVLCGFILIVMVCWRIIQSSRVTEYVIPAAEGRELVIAKDLPNPETVTFFVLDVQNACKKYWADRRAKEISQEGDVNL